MDVALTAVDQFGFSRTMCGTPGLDSSTFVPYLTPDAVEIDFSTVIRGPAPLMLCTLHIAMPYDNEFPTWVFHNDGPPLPNVLVQGITDMTINGATVSLTGEMVPRSAGVQITFDLEPHSNPSMEWSPFSASVSGCGAVGSAVGSAPYSDSGTSKPSC